MPTRRMVSATSFGVFCRSAPSTSAIMRSRKEEPGAAVIRTTIQSERTVVPPVTPERSPPASRITGADSPVTAASFTEAMPSTISPSPGTRSPASTSTWSPTSSSRADARVQRWRSPGWRRRLASVSVRALRRLSAWARPRPSAIASAKLAKSTVNQSQAVIWPVKRTGPPVTRSRRRRVVTSAATTSVTKITGFLASVLGSSFFRASAAARPIRPGDATEAMGFADMEVLPAGTFRTASPPASARARRWGRGRERGRTGGRRE